MSNTIPAEAIEKMKRREVVLRIHSMRDGITKSSLLLETLKKIKLQEERDVRKAFIDVLNEDDNPAELALDYGFMLQAIEDASAFGVDKVDAQVIWEKTDETPDREWQQKFLETLKEQLGAENIHEQTVVLNADESMELRRDIAERAAGYANTST